MKRIPVNEKPRKQFQELNSSLAESGSISMDAVLTKRATIVLLEILEQQVADFLGRDPAASAWEYFSRTESQPKVLYFKFESSRI